MNMMIAKQACVAKTTIWDDPDLVKSNPTYLKNKRYFLYINNLSNSAKFESLVKSLGADVVSSLDSRVHTVLTDAADWENYSNKNIGRVNKDGSKTTVDTNVNVIPTTNKTPDVFKSVLSNESIPTPSSVESGSECSKKRASRGMIILDKLDSTSYSASQYVFNPLVNAKKLNISVYSLELYEVLIHKKLKFFEFISSRRIKSEPRTLKGQYIKVEFGKGGGIDFKQTSKLYWPAEERCMKQNEKSKHCEPKISTAGYCEICDVNYPDIGIHVKSDTHLKILTYLGFGKSVCVLFDPELVKYDEKIKQEEKSTLRTEKVALNDKDDISPIDLSKNAN